MSTDIKDFEQVAEEVGKQFEAFKKANDKKLEAITQEKAKLSEQVDRLNEKLGELDKLKSELQEELKAVKRPANEKQVDTAYKEAFVRFVRKGEEGQELRSKAAQVGVDADGGYAVPEELDRNVLELLKAVSPMRQVCSLITVGTPQYKRNVNLGGAGAGWVDETEARPETSTPKLTQVSADVHELYANPQATQQSLDDVYFNVESWLSEEVTRAFNAHEGKAFLAGSGVKQPKGLLTAPMAETGDASRPFGTLQSIRNGDEAQIKSDALLSLIYALQTGYQASARWMMATLTLAEVRKLKDSQGNYLWQPGLQAGQPSSLLGFGVVTNEDMPPIGKDKQAVIFGDFARAYSIIDRIGTRMLRDPYTHKPYVSFYTTKRVGGILLDTQAVKVLKMSK